MKQTLVGACPTVQPYNDIYAFWNDIYLFCPWFQACLSEAPSLHSVIAEDCSRKKTASSGDFVAAVAGGMPTPGRQGVNANAATWAGLQEVGHRLQSN